jgi:hypothetical protein
MCLHSWKYLARNGKRYRRELEAEHVTDHGESTAGFEENTLCTNTLLTGPGPEGANRNETIFALAAIKRNQWGFTQRNLSEECHFPKCLSTAMAAEFNRFGLISTGEVLMVPKTRGGM